MAHKGHCLDSFIFPFQLHWQNLVHFGEQDSMHVQKVEKKQTKIKFWIQFDVCFQHSQEVFCNDKVHSHKKKEKKTFGRKDQLFPVERYQRLLDGFRST
jgi:hypothetical protein